MEYKELNKYNRLQLIKIICELQNKNKILKDAISQTLEEIEHLKKVINKESDDYDWELYLDNQRQHIS